MNTVDKNRVFGLDTSHWSGVIDWHKAKAAGVTFMIAKAVDGAYGPVRYFVENINGAKKAGIYTGAYAWLYDSNVIPIAKQVEAMAKILETCECELPPTIDFEWTKPVNPDKGDLYEYLIQFERRTGKKPMIYTAPSYWMTYGDPGAFWDRYDLWIANYGVTEPMRVAPWGNKWILWQFSDKVSSAEFGYPKGGESSADVNYFNGDNAAFLKWIGRLGEVTEPAELSLDEKVARLWAAHPELNG